MSQGHHDDAQPVDRGSEDRRVSWGLRRGGMSRSGLILELGSVINLERWAERVRGHLTEEKQQHRNHTHRSPW